MSLDVGVSDLPKTWRGAAVLGSLLILGGLLTLGLIALVDNRAAAQAETTTRQVLAKDIEAFKVEAKSAAESAARDGARNAVEAMKREVIAPLAEKVDKLATTQADQAKFQAEHKALDDERHQQLKDEVRELKQRSR